MRLDKWLWAARFYKTRSLAQQAIEAGRVRLGGERVKPSREIRPGELLAIRVQDLEWQIVVRGLSQRRGPSAEARLLYEESESSRTAREALLARRKVAYEPAHELEGRPSKQDRRALRKLRGF
ncbi:MAG TPA: RNA-binding S4 domain-containing protein [Burkholderiales bacterium]|nr:RNA-binding S4 domain-containing protein [Burkholderiales bacterium]